MNGGRTAVAEHSSSVEPPMARGYGRVPLDADQILDADP